MSDLFSSYAEATIPPAVQRKQAQQQAERPLSELEKKMAERQRLTRAYRAQKRQWRAQQLQAEPRLRDFMRYLRTVTPANGSELIEAIASSWLAQAARDVRLFALELVSRHCDRVNRRMGFEPLDDPMPPHSSLYFECRELLHPGGRS